MAPGLDYPARSTPGAEAGPEAETTPPRRSSDKPPRKGRGVKFPDSMAESIKPYSTRDAASRSPGGAAGRPRGRVSGRIGLDALGHGIRKFDASPLARRLVAAAARRGGFRLRPRFRARGRSGGIIQARGHVAGVKCLC